MSVELNRELRFGSNLFINPEDTAELLRERVSTLRQAGLTLIRLFLAWNQIEPEPGRFEWSPYDDIFDEAGRRGVKIIGTLMSGSPPGWMGLTQGMSEMANLDDPQFHTVSVDHVRRVVSHFKNSPALDSWILWNEPGRSPSPQCPHVQQAFQRYLEQSYQGDIAAYNRDHFRPAASFSEIKVAGTDLRQAGFLSHRSKVEWLSFITADLQEKLAGLAAEVRKWDPDHPIHVNPHRVSQCLAESGQSIWRQADLVDFMGCSSHPAWHSVRFPRERFSASLAMFGDLTRSATRAEEEYFWITELQGGVTLLSGFVPLTATPAEARLWLWECVGTGAKAVVYWCANARSDGFEAGEWDLLDVKGRPSPQLNVISGTIRRLEEHREVLKAARPARPDVGILLSEESQLLDLVEGEGASPENPRNVQRGCDAVAGAYLLAADLSLEVKFFDLPRFLQTPAEELPRILLVPSLTVASAEAIAHLQAAVVAGMRLIADGFFSWKDCFGRLARPTWPGADSLFGAECLAYEAATEKSFAIDDGAQLPAFFSRTRLQVTTARTLAHWKDGGPAITLNQVGQGTACRAGTQVFQNYFLSADAGIRRWLEEMIVPHLASKLRLVHPPQGLRLRRLHYQDREIGIVINSTESPLKAKVRNGAQVEDHIVPAQDAVLVLP